MIAFKNKSKKHFESIKVEQKLKTLYRKREQTGI